MFHISPEQNHSPTSYTSDFSPPTRVSTRLSHNITKPNPKYYNFSYILNTATTTHIAKPSTLSQALKHPLWRKPMDDEFAALTKNNTWSLVPSSSASNVIGCKWVF